ncbi:MAG: M56 family metallopeptidase, partial [Lachnospiraceae bacterium]|nr:M56 family metallopeptidase [Lachnospiraceae bacterium]
MDRFFSAILQTGIYSLGIILIIVLLRTAFKKRASKTVLCALWLFAAIRLMLPLQLESDYALLPDISIINNDENTVASENEKSNVAEFGILQENDTTPVSMDIANGNILENYEISPEVNTKIEETEVRKNSIGDTDYLKPVLDNGEESASAIPNSDTGHDNAVSVLSVLGYIWLAGIAVFILLMVRRYVNVKKKLKDAVLLAPYDDVYSSNAISSAFVFGIIKPGIYVSSSVKTEQLDYVLAHERAHISRKDYITKLLAYLILSVYWFVPWVWAAYILFGRDVELACDEKVILEKSETYRADYAQVLLDSTISYSHKEA